MTISRDPKSDSASRPALTPEELDELERLDLGLTSTEERIALLKKLRSSPEKRRILSEMFELELLERAPEDDFAPEPSQPSARARRRDVAARRIVVAGAAAALAAVVGVVALFDGESSNDARREVARKSESATETTIDVDAVDDLDAERFGVASLDDVENASDAAPPPSASARKETSAKVGSFMGEPPVAASTPRLRSAAPQTLFGARRIESGGMGGVREPDLDESFDAPPSDFSSASRSSSDFSTSVPPRRVDASLAVSSIFGETPVEPLKSDEVAAGVAERLRRRDFDGAELEFECLPESFRRSVEGETFRGILAFRKEDYAAAAEAFRLAFNQSPNDATLAYNLATTLKILGERQSADALFESVWSSDLRDDVERLKELDDDAWKENAARRASRATKER